MIRIFPLQISSSQIDSLVRELHAAKPYTDDNWETASIDFESLNITINARLPKQQYTETECNRIENVIRKLADMQRNVIETMTKSDDATANEDHELSWIDIDFDEDDVDLCYVGISYNTQWNKTFRFANDQIQIP